MGRAGGDGSLLQRINTAAVLRALHGAGESTVRDLAAAIGVSRNTAEDAAVALVGAGLAEEFQPEPDPRRVGRPAKWYRFRLEYGYVLGVDMAVHEVNVLVADLAGAQRARRSRPLDPMLSADQRILAIREVMDAAIRDAGIREDTVLAVGAASTGIVDRSGRVARSNRLPGMQGRNLSEDLAVPPNAAVVIGNDARLATLAECRLGTGRGIDNFVNIVAGRHITAGIVLNGRLLQGVHGAAGEIGVLPESRWQSALNAVAAWPQEPETTIRAAVSGDTDARARVEEFAEHLATGIAALVLTVDPECVIVSGGLSRAGKTLLDPLREHVHAKTLFPVPVRASTLDHNAVALGAVRLALDHVENELFDTDSPHLAACFAS